MLTQLASLGLFFAVIASPVASRAQAPSLVWERSLELSGEYLYRHADQAILSIRSGVVRNDSSVAVRLDLDTRFLIGVTDREGEERLMDGPSLLDRRG
jgi:hypothetical protein